MSCTTIASSGARAIRCAVSSAIRGWVIAFKSARAASSPKTLRASSGRFSAPCSSSTSGPNRSTISARPGVPGATTSLASWSASMRPAPCSCSRRATVDLPEPMPPLNPTRSTRSSCPVPTPAQPPRRTKTAPCQHGAGSDTHAPVPPISGSRPAPELVPQRRQLSVAGQRAAVLLRLRGVVAAALLFATFGFRSSGFRLGLPGLGDLSHVLLVASVGFGVLALPLVPLLLVAGLPLLGLRVEALGVDVVPLGVVLGDHAVLGRVELRVRREALVGLLQRQGDPTTLQVDVDDLDHDLVADLDDLLRDLHVPLGQLGDVHQALDAL